MPRTLWASGFTAALLMGAGLIWHHQWVWLLGAVLLFLVMLVALFLVRSLPMVEGELRLEGLQAPVDVRRDEHGIPHLRAEHEMDLYLAQGYVMAADRLWQMDLTRRLVQGRLSEVMGSKSLALDRFFRNMSLHHSAKLSAEQMSPAARRTAEAFVAGVNARMRQGRLPLEFHLLRYRPDPWTVADCADLGKMMAFTLGGNWRGEMLRTTLVQSVGSQQALELFPAPPPRETLAWLEELAELKLPDLAAIDQIARPFLDEAVGSNNWVVAGSKTKSGKPMLANDPHLGVGVPATWYEVHLTLPGELDVIGVTFPGVPGVVLGRNRHLAWGATNVNPDVQDLYVEKRTAADPARLLHKGTYEKAVVRDEPIKVRGSQPQPHKVLVSRHGPVIAPLDPLGADKSDPNVLALRWTALAATSEFDAIYRMNRATDWPTFRDALRHFAAPAQNWVCACTDGTIAWKAAGLVPVRAGGDGQVPVPGWTDDWEWTGYIPFDELPEKVNPPEGFIATANENITPSGYPHLLGTGWAPNYRQQRIAQRLGSATKPLTMQDMQELQCDWGNLQARDLLPILLQASQQGATFIRGGYTPTEQRCRMLLATWDGQEAPNAPAPLIYHQWLLHTMEELLRPLGIPLRDYYLSAGNPLYTFDRFLRRLAEGESSLFCGHDPANDTSFQRLALRALRRTCTLLTAKYGHNPESWRWDEEHRIALDHPLAAAVPLFRPLLSLSSLPTGGGTTTVCAAGYRLGNPFAVTLVAPWRFITDLSELGGQAVLLPGQSGNPLSLHYKDQVRMWAAGQYRPLRFSMGTLEDAHTLKLLPPHQM